MIPQSQNIGALQENLDWPYLFEESNHPAEAPKLPMTFNLVAHLHRQREFSERTFGPGPRTQMILDHAAKEMKEIRLRPDSLEEWVDLILLSLDGAWRAGYSPEDVVLGIEAKQGINERREWPDWHTADPNAAIEHVRHEERRLAGALLGDEGFPDAES